VKQSKTGQKKKVRGLTRFRKTELQRIVRATIDAGLSVARIEVDPVSARISVIPGEPDKGNVKFAEA
jgi:hypothetical protein